jgi:hypothetical protein
MKIEKSSAEEKSSLEFVGEFTSTFRHNFSPALVDIVLRNFCREIYHRIMATISSAERTGDVRRCAYNRPLDDDPIYRPHLSRS